MRWIIRLVLLLTVRLALFFWPLTLAGLAYLYVYHFNGWPN